MAYGPTPSTLALVQRLGGRWNARYALVPCPAHEDRTPSLSIRQGRQSIPVHCFAGCDGSEVIRAIRAVLGHPVLGQRALPMAANERPAPFQRLWNEASPTGGTLAQRYLHDIRGITFLPPDVRFHPACPMGRGPVPRRPPALLVGVFKAQRLMAIQRLFLDPATGRRTHRMMLGNSRGGTWPAAIGQFRKASGNRHLADRALPRNARRQRVPIISHEQLGTDQEPRVPRSAQARPFRSLH